MIESTGDDRERWFLVVALLLACVLFASMFLAGFEPAEDAFITFRVSCNWAGGHGPVYNIGERVEAYTNHLWMGIIALVCKLGLLPENTAPAIALLAFMAMMILFYSVLPSGSKWVVLLVGMDFHLALTAVSGMETTLVAFLMSAFFVLLQKRRFLVAGIIAALLGMSRSDGFVLVGLTSMFFMAIDGINRENFKSLIKTALVFFVFFTPFFLLRSQYYGRPLPNTYYAKIDIPFDFNLRYGLRYLLNFVKSYAPLMAACVIGLVLWVKHNKIKLRHLAAVIAPALLLMGYIQYVGGDTDSVGIRFYVPIILLLYTGVGLGFTRRHAPAVIAVLAAISLISGSVMIKGQREYLAKRFQGGYRAIGQIMGDVLPPDSVLCVGAIGQIGYYSGLKILDHAGLADEQVAHEGPIADPRCCTKGHVKTGYMISLAKRPDFFWFQQIVKKETPMDKIVFPHICPRMHEMLRDPVFQKLYQPVPLPISQTHSTILYMKIKPENQPDQ